MRAYVIDEPGQPGTVREVPRPELAAGEVLVRVHTASVNPMDAFVASGGTKAYAETRVPLVPGIDASGIIEAVGPGGDQFKPGDEVLLVADVKPYWGEGTFAELVAVPDSAVALKPAGVSDQDASTLPLAGLTALGVIEQVDAGPGKVIAVIGATGGVGGWFTQLAANRGAQVIAVVKPDNAAYARQLGATEVVEYTEPSAVARLRDTHTEGIDAIADFSGSADTIELLVPHLRDGGKLVSSGMMVDADSWATRGVTAEQAHKADASRLSELVGMLDSGQLVAPESRLLSLDDASQAIADVGQRHTRGKVVLDVRG